MRRLSFWLSLSGHGGGGQSDHRNLPPILRSSQRPKHFRLPSGSQLLCRRGVEAETEEEEEPIRRDTVPPQLGDRIQGGEDPLARRLLRAH